MVWVIEIHRQKPRGVKRSVHLYKLDRPVSMPSRGMIRFRHPLADKVCLGPWNSGESFPFFLQPEPVFIGWPVECPLVRPARMMGPVKHLVAIIDPALHEWFHAGVARRNMQFAHQPAVVSAVRKNAAHQDLFPGNILAVLTHPDGARIAP